MWKLVASVLPLGVLLLLGSLVVEGFVSPFPSASTGRTTPSRRTRKNHQLGSKSSRPHVVKTLERQASSSGTTHAPTTTSTSTTYSHNVTFPSYAELMDCGVGDCVVSEPFRCGNASFCVKLYPRGGGHGTGTTTTTTTGNSQQGFGMAYKILPMLDRKSKDKVENQRVGMYLQFLGMQSNNTAGDDFPSSHHEQSIDATFALRLKGNQQIGRKFDVEWRAGIRMVPPGQKTDLSRGQANDFGAHLMQTSLLKDFMGISDQHLDPTPLLANAEVTIHDAEKEDGRIMPVHGEGRGNKNGDMTEDKKPTSFFSMGEDIRIPKGIATKDQQHDGKRVRCGNVVVPILTKLSQRPKLFAMGAYPGVEYRILSIFDPQTGQERFTSCPDCDYELKPIYPLVAQLERPWPVRINEADIPRLYTTNMYNAVSALGSLFTAVTGLATAFIVSQAVSLFFIPSRSMDPTLQVGDVLLVDKVSPRLFSKSQKAGDIVLFSPPNELRNIVAANGGKLTSRDLFVKRIAAQGGDTVAVDGTGRVQINGQMAPGRRDMCEAEPLRLIEKYVKTRQPQVVDDDTFFVMGDCSSVSIDSRVWGTLQGSEIVGKPILRLWPLERFGALPSLQPLTTVDTDAWQD